jgi:molybdopterin-guanine dinucleotide biosynthesis protein A
MEVTVKIAILAGGVGSRLAEETETKPKPMVEIGGKPILWHGAGSKRIFGSPAETVRRRRKDPCGQ